MKENIKKLIFIILCITLTFSIIKVVFDNKKEIHINNKNKKEMVKLISEVYEKPEQITKVQLRVLLGDGELYLYRNFKLEKKCLIGEGREIFMYICENGDKAGGKYIIMIIVSLFGMLVIKTSDEYGDDDK